MYTFFSKLGYKKRQYEWLPIFIVRLCLGLFFILSGFFKIFDSMQHEALLKTLTSIGIPFPELNAYIFPIVELLAGSCILVGFFTSLASFLLFILIIMALVTDQITSVVAHGGIKILENFFYLPEVLYALMVFWLFFSGPGKVSIDYAYGKRQSLTQY